MAGKTTKTTKPAAKRTAAKKTVSTAPVRTPARKSAEPKKPAIRTGTIVTVVLFAAIALFAFFFNRQKAAEAELTPTGEATEETFVFEESAGDPVSIEIKPAEGDTVKLVRNEEKVWALELPFEIEADQGLAEAAASGLTSLKVDRVIEGKASTFGLDNPSFVITVEFSSGKTHTLEVGDVTPTNSGYYIRLDNEKMMIVGLSGIDALSNLVFAPPYLNTPTPSPMPPTETPIPAAETPTATPAQ